MRDLDHRLWAQQSQELALGEIFRFLGVAADGAAARTTRGESGLTPSADRQAAI
jgi:hypothetical protein